MPQAYFGITFGFGIPMAFTAVQTQAPPLAWVIMLAHVFWSLAYDTAYAMVDRDDDIKIDIRTSALIFGKCVVLAVMLCYFVVLAIYAVVGYALNYTWLFWLGLAATVGCVAYLYTLIRALNPASALLRLSIMFGCMECYSPGLLLITPLDKPRHLKKL